MRHDGHILHDQWLRKPNCPCAGNNLIPLWGVSSQFDETLTLALNKNSSSTTLAVSIGATTTGWVTDSTDSARVSSGDALDFVTHLGGDKTDGYSGSFYCVSARFDADTDSAQLLATVGPGQIFPTTTLQYVNFLGTMGDGSPTESDQQFRCLTAGKWQNMACYIQFNGFNRATTVHNRINNSNGSMSFSIPANTSGSFEDTANSDAVNAGDLLDYGIIGASESGTGSFEMIWVGAHFLASTASYCMIGGAADMPATIDSSQTDYSSLFGGGNPFRTDIARATGLLPYSLTASKYTNHVTNAGDNNTGAATFTLLKNGNSALALSSSTGETGYISSSEIVSFSAGDTCANQLVLITEPVYWASGTLLLQAS